MIRARSSYADINHYILVGLIASLLVHIVMWWTVMRPAPTPVALPVIADVVFEPPRQSAPQQQIVSAPPTDPPKEPLNTNLRAEQDSQVEREQIRRGDPEAGPAVGPKQPSTRQSAPAPVSKPRTSQPAPRKLSLDTKTLIEKFGTTPNERAPKPDKLDLNPASDMASYQPFSRPFGSGARFLGATGSQDYLPSLPDGDITMLNAKASRFAVFVRRVATRVFAEMRTNGWEVLRGGDINSASDFATVRVTMSPKGEVLKVSLDGSSGAQRFDQVLVGAARNGAKDPNPPEAALAADGNIHFIFQSRSWAVLTGEPRTGRPMERRWLLLGTGLE